MIDELVKADRVRVIGSLNDSQAPIEAVNNCGCVFILMGINTNKPVGTYIFHRFYISLKINYHQYTASHTKRSERSILLSDVGDIKWVSDSL
ncbi:MAG TPA: hypothetical protein ENL19_00325 [candidate division WOR-3 bacterium]|uniref:Uncharacterized protein n=1 Tax=candidate division WOR-3 bacterium TaxID=2052148 RepID=A0A7C5H5E2_UNCW3|nr:hypothetical protein [candidate division WOR-3 bacterium]